MQSKIISVIAVFLLAAGTGYYIWNDLSRQESKPGFDLKKQSQEQETGQIEQNNNICDESGTTSDCAVAVKKTDIPIPDLDRPVKISADLDFSEDEKKNITEKIAKLSEELKKNPDLLSEWLLLGIHRKTIGDYEGAKECWEYAGVISPYNSTSFNNLGDLYGYYLKDYKKAEENFLKALENSPQYIYIYRNTYEFYKYALKDGAKANAILEKGIEMNPDNSRDLKILLDNF